MRSISPEIRKEPNAETLEIIHTLEDKSLLMDDIFLVSKVDCSSIMVLTPRTWKEIIYIRWVMGNFYLYSKDMVFKYRGFKLEVQQPPVAEKTLRLKAVLIAQNDLTKRKKT